MNKIKIRCDACGWSKRLPTYRDLIRKSRQSCPSCGVGMGVTHWRPLPDPPETEP